MFVRKGLAKGQMYSTAQYSFFFHSYKIMYKNVYTLLYISKTTR